MDGMAVLSFTLTSVPRAIKAFLDSSLVDINELGYVVLHQANKMIVDQVAQKLKISTSACRFDAGSYGNTGPASIPIALSRELSLKEPSNLKTTMLCGFGVGLSWAIALLDLSQTKTKYLEL